MAIRKIPDADNLARYCSPEKMRLDGIPSAAVFRLRPGEAYLSVNWLEFFGESDLSSAVQCVRQAFRKKGYRVAKTGKFAVLSVGSTKAAIAEVGLVARVEHRPTRKDQSHAAILGCESDALAAALALQRLIRNKDLHPSV